LAEIDRRAAGTTRKIPGKLPEIWFSIFTCKKRVDYEE